jgi:hypothetical protein
MTCDEFNYSVNLIYDNLGNAELSNEIQNHIKICYICSQEYNRLKNYFDKLNSNPKGIEVSEKFIQDTIDVILQNKALPIRETSTTPTEVKLKSQEIRQEQESEPEIEPEVKSEEKFRSFEQAVVKEVEIKTEKKAPRKRVEKAVNTDRKSYDLYFFYAVIGVSCLIIAYIILQFFIH